MENKQEQLSLEVEGTVTDEGLLETLPDTLKVLDRDFRAFGKARKALAPLSKPNEASTTEVMSALGKAISTLRTIKLESVLLDLDRQRAELARRREDAFERRREDLARSAKAAGWAVRRLRHYDFVRNATLRQAVENRFEDLERVLSVGPYQGYLPNECRRRVVTELVDVPALLHWLETRRIWQMTSDDPRWRHVTATLLGRNH